LLNSSVWAEQIPVQIPLVLIDTLVAYCLVYVLVPLLQKRKYFFFLFASIIVLSVGFYFLTRSFELRYPKLPTTLTYWNALLELITNTFVAGALFYLMENVAGSIAQGTHLAALKQEKIKAELQLLRAQVHPHFLFNTLNNIYSFSLDGSPIASDLVAKLSQILRYMADECSQPLVPLHKEISIMDDYLALEKVRYGNRLGLTWETTGSSEGKWIAPLLMIPFVENSFKHGASKMLERPWIKLNIEIGERELLFKLSNSKQVTANSNGTTNTTKPPTAKNGLGLHNVKRRLELLYPVSHILEIKPEHEIFSVQMTIPLEQGPATAEAPVSELLTITQPPAYARA
jgi:LytS/YehU family sensor histidine kinase